MTGRGGGGAGRDATTCDAAGAANVSSDTAAGIGVGRSSERGAIAGDTRWGAGSAAPGCKGCSATGSCAGSGGGSAERTGVGEGGESAVISGSTARGFHGCHEPTCACEGCGTERCGASFSVLYANAWGSSRGAGVGLAVVTVAAGARAGAAEMAGAAGAEGACGAAGASDCAAGGCAAVA